MMNESQVSAARTQLLSRLFPDGVPGLWCPPLTHYDRDGAIDGPRIAAHLKHLSPHVKGFLIPGSTGDAWELSARETEQLIGLSLVQARELNLHVLIGALKPDAATALEVMRETVERKDAGSALSPANVCGFTVCAPRGKDLSQDEIGRGLESILEVGLPTAIYQLPQVTQNEIGADLASELASRFPNFILFKDTSGTDRVALSGKSLAGVFLVRGAEGDYARWLRGNGGPYHGFLLSTANCFAGELHEIMRDIAAGHVAAAGQLSGRVSSAVTAVFKLVGGLRDGNPFANANKAIDHFRAHGPRAAGVPPPRLHAGSHLPIEVIRATGEVLSEHGLLPAKGYLE